MSETTVGDKSRPTLREDVSRWITEVLPGLEVSDASRRQWKIGVESLAELSSERALEALPEDFISTWLEAQGEIAGNTKGLRLTGIRHLIEWLSSQGRIAPNFAMPAIQRKRSKKENHTVADEPNNDETIEPKAPGEGATVTRLVPPLGGKKAPKDPLRDLLPSGHRLRVWLETEDHAALSYIGDFAEVNVRRYGAVEPFIAAIVHPKRGPRGREATYWVASIDAAGRQVSDKLPAVIAATPDDEPLPQPAEVPAAPAPSATAPALSANDVAAAAESRAQAAKFEREAMAEEVIARARAEGRTVDAATLQRALDENADLRRRMDERHRDGVYAPTDRVLEDRLDRLERKLDALASTPPPATAAIPSATSPVKEAFGMLAEAKEVFQPEIADTSALEHKFERLQDKLDDTLTKLASSGSGAKSRSAEFAEEAKTWAGLFGVQVGAGGLFGGPREPVKSATEALERIVTTVFSRIPEITDGVERTLNAMARTRAGIYTDPKTGETKQLPPGAGLPEDVSRAMTRILETVNDENDSYAAVIGLVQTLDRHPDMKPVVAKIVEASEQGGTAIVGYLYDVYQRAGFRQATPEMLQKTVLNFQNVRARMAAVEEEHRAQVAAARKAEAERVREPEEAPEGADEEEESDEEEEVVAAENGGAGDEDAKVPEAKP